MVTNHEPFILLGVRALKTVEEIIDMYRISTPRIFQQSKWQKVMNWMSNKLAGVPIYPYGLEGLGIVLEGWGIIQP